MPNNKPRYSLTVDGKQRTVEADKFNNNIDAFVSQMPDATVRMKDASGKEADVKLNDLSSAYDQGYDYVTTDQPIYVNTKAPASSSNNERQKTAQDRPAAPVQQHQSIPAKPQAPATPQQQGKQEPGFFSRLWQSAKNASAKDALSSAGQTGPEGHAVAAGAAIGNMLQQGPASKQHTQQKEAHPQQQVQQPQKDAQQTAQAAPKQNVEPGQVSPQDGQVSPQDAWRNQPITVGYLTKGQHDTTQGAVYDQMYKEFEDYYNKLNVGDHRPTAIRYLTNRAWDYNIDEGAGGGVVVTPKGNRAGDDIDSNVAYVRDANGNVRTENTLGNGRASNIVNNVLTHFLTNKAQAAAEELAKKIPYGVNEETALDALRDNYYQSGYQKQLWTIASKSGVQYKDFINEIMKPVLNETIKRTHNGLELPVNSLFSDWDYAAEAGKEYDPNALNADERKLYDALMTDFDQRLSADRATARGKANELAGRETASNLAIGGRGGHAMQLGVPMETLREYNAYADPSKAINYVLDKLMGNGGGNVIAGGNGDGINRQAIGNLLYRKIMDKLVQERIPKSKWGYVLKGFMDGDIGELFKNYTQTDFERHLDNLADKKYMQSLKGFSGMLATGGHEATKFLSDAWEYYLGGKVGSAVTSALRKRAIKRFAGDLMERGIQRNVAEGIAARAFQRTAQNAGRKAVMGAVHGAGTMGTAQAISGSLRQSISPAAGAKMDEILQRKANGEQISKQQEAQEIAEANKEAHSLTSILGAGAEGGLSGAVAGLSFGPGTYVGETVSKWASKYMGDLASAATGYMARLGTNAASATAIGQAEGAITGEKPEGSIGNQFAQNLVTFALLDAQGAAPRMLNGHPIKSYRAWKEYERSYGISTEDQQRMRDAGYGDLIDTIDGLVSERFRDKGSTTLPNSGWKPQEESTRINEGMMKLLSDNTLPEELKRKYYSLVTGDDSKQLSPVVASEVTTDEDGNHYLVTYNKYGNVVSDRQYHNEKSAQDAQMKIGHEQDENLTDALQQGVFAKDADALMEQAYQAAVDAFKNGDGTLGKGQQTLLYLYQNKERLTKALAAAGTGEPLSESDQRLVSLFNTVQKQLFEHDANSHDGNIYNIARAAEAANGLASHSLYVARKGHTEKEAKKLAEENGEEAVHVGGDVWRTASEDAAVKDYQQRLYDYMSGIEEGQGAEVKEPGEEAAALQPPTEPSAPDVAEATQQPPTEPSTPEVADATQQPSTEPSAPDVADATQQPPTEPSTPKETVDAQQPAERGGSAPYKGAAQNGSGPEQGQGQTLPPEALEQGQQPQGQEQVSQEQQQPQVLAEGAGQEKTPLQQRMEAGYERGMGIDSDETQLAQIQHDIDLANQRFNQAFGDGNMNAFRNGMIEAVKNDDEDAMRKLLDKYGGQLSDEQREAIYGLIEIGAVQNGIDDSITSQTMEYRDQRQQELADISDAQGNITRLTLDDGTTAYLKNGDITNEYGGVVVVDMNGKTKQIPVSSIKQAEEPVSAQQQLDDDTNAFAEDLKTGYQRLASGADMLPGQQAYINISGKMFHVTVDRELEDGRYQLIMDDGSPIVLTSDEMQQAVAAARNESVSTELANQQQQRAAQETEARRTKGIAGYAEGNPDLGAAETDPSVAGEYLRQKQAADGKDPLPGIESEIEAQKSAQQQARQDLDRQEQWMEINGDQYTPEEKATKGSIIEQRKKEIADTRQRIRKLGEVRNAYMSSEQRMKLRNDRMRKSEEARKTALAEWQKAQDAEKPKQATVDGIDNKTLLDNYATQTDAENYLQRRREEVIHAYRDGASNTISDMQRRLQNYTDGLEELTPDELKSLHSQLAEAKEQERLAMEQVKQIKAQQQKLGTLYKERNKAELDKMEPADRRAELLKGARTPEELLKKAHEAYKGSDFEGRLDELEPETLEEYVSQNLGYGTLNWEGTGTGINKKKGLKQELGLTRGIGHGFDSNGINAYIAPKGQGMSVDMAAHKMWEHSRGTQFDSYDDQDFKNAILDLLGSAQKATDIKYLTIRNRINEVEDYERHQDEQERWYKEQEEEELKARQQDIDTYNDYLNAIAESRLLTPEQESYLNGLYADEIAEAEQEEADRKAAWEAYEAEKEEEQLKQNNDGRTATETNDSGSEVDRQSEPRTDDSGDGKSEETVPSKAAHQPAAETEHHAQREVRDRSAHTPTGDSDADGSVSLSAQKLKEIKKRASQFSAETEEESGAFGRLVPKMSDKELLAYMRIDGNGDPNEAYHPELYDEYDSRHNDEEVEAYNSYLQQLRDSGTTTEQAEDMLAKVQLDYKTYGATDERSMLTGQQDALIDYISELNHQEEKSPSEEQGEEVSAVKEAEKRVNSISSEIKKVSEDVRDKHLAKVVKKFKLSGKEAVTPEWVAGLDDAQRKAYDRREKLYKKELEQATSKLRVELQEAQLDLENARDARRSDEVREKFIEAIKPKEGSIEARVLSAIENGDDYDFLTDLSPEEITKVKDYSERLIKTVDDMFSDDDADAADLNYYSEQAEEILDCLDNSDFETIKEDTSVTDSGGKYHLGQHVTFEGKEGIVYGFNGMGEVLVKVRNGSAIALSPDDGRLASSTEPDGVNGSETEPTPVGTGDFGPIYDQFQGKPNEAFAFLKEHKKGYLKGVFHRDDIGDIDLVWGTAPTNYTGKGLAHIIRKHVEVLGDFSSAKDAFDTISDVIVNGEAYDGGNNTWNIEKGNYRVVIARDENGNWILSAFDFKTPKKKKKGSVTPLTPNQTAYADGAGAVAPNLSAAKLVNSSESSDKKSENVGEGADNSVKEAAAQQRPTERSNDSGHSIGATDTPGKVAAERQNVNTEPTEGQKEAGNYKKGHIKVDGYDITIENPKGSTRSGKDASGKAWSVPMHYDYGYIKGTEGVDGDHIDVYLSDEPTKGNVYVVDQINQKDGSFDEHKVMYGFPSMEAAVEAYKGQYEDGWKVGTVTEVSREDFKKWVESSRRKTKPFADYKSMEAAAKQQRTESSVRTGTNGVNGSHGVNGGDVSSDQENGVKSFKITPKEYTTKRGKKLPMHLVTFEGELSKEQMNAAKKLAKDAKGWWSKEDGGFLMRDMESAQKLADSMLDDAVAKQRPTEPSTKNDTYGADGSHGVNGGDVSAGKKLKSAEDVLAEAERRKRLTSDEGAKKTWESLVNPNKLINFANNEEAQAKWVNDHLSDIVDGYIATCKNGNTLDPDELRKVFTGIGYDGKNVPQFRVSEKHVVDILYAKMLLKALSSGRSSITLLTGVGGAGKSTATRQMDLSNRGVVYDSAFNSFSSLEKAIKKAKAAGIKDIQVVAVHNDALTAFKNTVNRGLSSGRFLSLSYFIDDAFPKNAGKIAALSEKYPDVDIVCYDNSHNDASNRENGGLVSLEVAKRWDYSVSNTLINQLLDIIEDGINKGRFTKDQAASLGFGLQEVPRSHGAVADPSTIERIARIGRRIRQEVGGDIRPSTSGEQPLVRGDGLHQPGGPRPHTAGKGAELKSGVPKQLDFFDLFGDETTGKPYYPIENGRRQRSRGVGFPVGWSLPTKDGRNIKVTKVLPDENRREVSWTDGEGKVHSEEMSTDALQHLADVAFGFADDNTNQNNYGKDNTEKAEGAGADSGADRPLGPVRPSGNGVLGSSELGRPDAGEVGGDTKAGIGLADGQPGGLSTVGRRGGAKGDADSGNTASSLVGGRRHGVSTGVRPDGEGHPDRGTDGRPGASERPLRVSVRPGANASGSDSGESPERGASSEEGAGVRGLLAGQEKPGKSARDEATASTRADDGSKKTASERNTPLNTRNYLYPKDGADIDNMSAKDRLATNVDALETLAQLVHEGRTATAEERNKLGKFRGWGGVDMTDVWNVDSLLRKGRKWDSSRRENVTDVSNPYYRLGMVIKSLDPDGKRGVFESIKKAALTSYYTPLPIAGAMNEYLSLAGYKGGGSMLDPSIGNGVFEGTMPKDMQQRTQIYGVELDWLTAQIAKNLYPDAHIQQSGYQEAELCKDAFDVVESNIPFGDIKVYDPTWRHDSSPAKKAAQGKIHTYFALKMMENAKPGGLVTIMTSNSIMDTPGNGIIRDALLEQGEFLGAVRLPDNTFKGAGTRVVTDVIFMRKYKDEDDRTTTVARDGYAEKQQQFSNVDTIKAHNASEGKDYDVRISGYYKSNPKMMLGKVVAGGQYRGDEFGLTSEEDANGLAKKMLDAIKKEIVGDRTGQLYDTHKSERKIYHAIREIYVGDGSYQSNGNIVEQNGKFGVLRAVSHNGVDMGFDFEENPKLKRFAARIRLYIPVRTALKKLIAAQINREPEKVIEGYRKELNSAYKAFRNRYGLLNDKANNFIAEDIDSYQMLSLEDIDEDTKKLKGLADIFTKNTIKPTIDTSKVKDPASAIATSLAQYGEVRPSFMEKVLGKDWPTLCGDTLYKVPFSESYVVSDDYLSGDVKSKLEDAKRAAEEDPAYKRNVEALEKVQPRDIPVGEINIRMGARWVPDKVYNDFMKKMFGIPDWDHVKSGVRYIPESDDYIINVDSSETGIEADKWATDRRSAKDIFEAAMKDRSLKVYDHHSDGSTSLNKSATELANSKVQDLRESFETWVTSDPERADALGKMYNEKFNRTVIRQWSAPFLQPVGLQGMTLRPHQQAAVWMLLNNRGGIVDHIVGAGKTLVMQTAIMEMRRMGIAKKPMIIALKATVGQIAKEFAQAYPAAKILAPTEKDFVAKNRKKLFAQIATNDYDCVIVSHDNYVKFGHTKEIESQTLREQLQQLEAAIMLMRTNDVNGRQSQLTKRQLKGLEKRKANLEARMKRIMDRPTDKEFCFENLGVDYIFVDECQRFKSLPYATTYNQVAGLGDPTGSTKAVALLNGVRYLQQLHQGDRGTVFLSGTTITNSLVEVYNLLNYLRPNMMKKLGYTTFDAWAAQFAVRSSELEYGVTNELKEKNRFRYFQNVSELGKMYAEIADVRNDYNLKLPKPKPRTHLVTIEPSDDLNIINEQIVNMVKTKDGSFFGIDGNDKTPWSLQASNLSTKASVSPRLVDPSLPDDPHGKLATACENVAKIYKQFDAQKGTQLIFCDTGVPSKGKEYDAYTDIINRLVNDYGIPRKEIVDIHTANTDDKRKALFKKVRDGQVRILIGGTVNMGTGVNVQPRLVALHHIDIPWQPADTEQRNGRGVRQGNIIARDFNDNNVDIYYYAVKGTLDTYRYQLQDIKGKMFAQFKLNTIDSDSAREFDEGEIDADGEIDPAQMVAMLSGNPVIFEKSKQDKLVKKLRRQESSEYNDYLRRKRNIESLKSRKESFEAYQRMNDRDKEFLERHGYDPSRPANDYKIVDGSGKEYPWKKATDAGKIIHKLWKSAKPFTLKGYGMEAHLVQNSSDLFGGQTILKPVSNHWALSELPYSVPLSDTDQAAGQAFANLVKSIYHSGEAYKSELDKLAHKLEGSDKIGEFQFSKQKQLEEALAKKKELDAEYQKLSDETNNNAEQETGEPQGSQDSGDDGALYRMADEEEAAKLDKEPTVKVYRAMQLINGKLYPPMMAAVKGKLVEPRELGQWEVADERPGIIENIKKNKAGEEIGYVTLDKGSKDSTGKKGTPIKGVAYNPYWHTSRSPLNDQFKSAWIRPNIVTVEVEVPVSELRSGYRAKYAKDPVGETDWHSGSVTKQLTAQGHSPRKVILSRYDKPIKVLSAAETAERIIDYIGDYDVTIPENVVTPQVRVELEKRGIKIGAPEKGVKKTEQIREAIERGLSVSDDMLRDTEVFDDGERLQVSIREGGYGVSGLNNDYRKLSDLLDAFRDKYPGYVATLVDNSGKEIDPYIDDLELANRWLDGINIQVEPWRKYLSAPYKGAAQNTYLARKTRNALAAVKHWADKMNLGDKVTVLTSTDGLQGKKARAKGWFDKKDDKITIVLPNHSDVSDVIRTLLHEGVAHYGLRQLFGEHFDTFLDNVYNNANHSVKSRIRDLELKYDGDKHKATEEYLAGLAEDTDFEHTVNSSWWSKIKNMFLDMLAKVGLKLRHALTDTDLRYVLWRSYENLKHLGEKRVPADGHLNEPIEEIEGEREPREAAAQRRPTEQRGNVAADYVEEAQEHSGEMRPLKSANDDKLSITSLPPSTTIPVTEIDGESPVSVQDAIRVIDHLPGSVDTLDGYHLNVSRTTRNKLKNEIRKHKNGTAVLTAMSHIEEIVGKSLLIEEHRDRMKIDGERKPDNPSDQNIEKTQRFYGAATIDGVPYRVKSTAIVSRNTDRTRMHNYEITKIELLSPIASTRQKAYTAVDNNSITLAKLLKNVEFSYEKGRKLLDEIENNGYGNAVESAGIKELGKRYRMGEAARTYSEGEQRDMGNAAEELGETLGGVAVTIEHNGKDGVKGSFDTHDNTVHVNIDEADGIEDVEATVCHEVLGHEGLKALFGSNKGVDMFGQFIYDNASKELRRKIVEKADEEGYEWTDPLRFSKAAQEVFSDIASEGPRNAEEFSLWRKVKHYVIRALKSLGIRIRGIVNDHDLRYYVLKTGKAVKKWSMMDEETQREAAEPGRIMYSRRGKPRKRKDETMAQYIERLRTYERWKQAEEKAKAANDPMPEKGDYDQQAQDEYNKAMDDWRKSNNIQPGDKEPSEFPKRKDGESPQDYAIRVADYESQSDIWKTAPNVFDYMKKAQDEYHAAYEAWKTRYDLQEMEYVDEKLYSGEPIPSDEPQTDEQHYDQLEVEHAVEQDAARELGDAVGMDLSAEGAQRHAKLAVIERRKNLESASADDAIFIHDLCRDIDALAKKKGMKPAELREKLIDVIESPVAQQDADKEVDKWVDVLNNMRAFQDAHSSITADGVKAAMPELTALSHLYVKYGVKPSSYEQLKEIHEAAKALADKFNDYYKDTTGYNQLFGDDIMQVGKYIVKMSEAAYAAAAASKLGEDPDVKAIVDRIHDWYDNFYHVIEDAGLRGDAGYVENGYINHIWDKEKSDAGAWEKYVENYQRTKSGNMRHRTISTYADGIEVGLVPKFNDVAQIMSYYSRQNNEAIANKKFLDDLSFLTVSELNKDGEVVRTLPVLNSHHPSRFDEEKYKMYHVPGVGDVWVLNEVSRRFSSIFGTMRTQDIPDWLSKIGKGYDLLGSTMKKIQLSISGFHALALTEVAIAQMGPINGVRWAVKSLPIVFRAL